MSTTRGTAHPLPFPPPFSAPPPTPHPRPPQPILRLSLLRCGVGRGKVFEIFCREQLLTNMALRELTPPERRKAMSLSFKELPEEELLALKQRAAIEELRLESLERAAARFKPITPYEFFAREQINNPALTGIGPREREVKLLQIYESLPEKAREAIQTRTDQYNAAHSAAHAAPALPVIPVRKKPTPAPEAASSSAASNKKLKKKKTKKLLKAAPAQKTADGEDKAKAAAPRKARAVSPYSVFVKEQMASLHHLAPQERIRVIAERWRSLTNEERQRRLEAGRAKLAAEAAASSDAADTEAAATLAAPAGASVPASFTTTFAAPPASLSPPPAGIPTDASASEPARLSTAKPTVWETVRGTAASAAAPSANLAGAPRR